MRFFPLLFLVFSATLQAQFAPAAGKPGSTALRHDSSCFVSWAKSCTINRGLMDISEPDTGYASVGDSLSAVGKAFQNGVVSLGDGGSVTLQFNYPIRNDSGWDFAVFENTFLDTFLELAFVEVSTDGNNFVRFAAASFTDTSKQTGSFGFTNPEQVNNLAGKYRVGFGTPFDLEELKDSSGIDVQNIRFVRIVDVVGSMNSAYATRDALGRKINDPWPTRFPSSGFDLDAVGVIHQNTSASLLNKKTVASFTLWPNPCGANSLLHVTSKADQKMEVYDSKNCRVADFQLNFGINTILHSLRPGNYYGKYLKTGEAFAITIIED